MVRFFTITLVMALGMIPEGTRTHAQENIVVVVPNHREDSEGDSSPIGNNLCAFRYQQRYPSAQFAAVPEPMLLTRIAWRLDGPTGRTVSFTWEHFRVVLATKTGSLGCVYADNLENDPTTVFEGSLPVMMSNKESRPGGPKIFDYIVELEPFIYDPEKGDLVMDVLSSTGLPFNPPLDSDTSTGSTLLFECGPDAESCCSGMCRHRGLVTQFTFRPLPSTAFLRGDCNGDGQVDISDAVFTLGSMFLGDGDPGCDDACDSNDDAAVDISDAIATLGVLFLGNGVIPFPGTTECGVDPTEDEVGCTTFGHCP